MHTLRAGLVVPLLIAVGAALPGVALAGAPGWSTPHTASAVPVGVYAAGPNGQGVQLFGSSGASQTRVAQMRAIKSDATQGAAVTIDAGGQPGVGLTATAVNQSGRLVAAWTLDALQAGPIGLAAALGARTALPRSATILPTVGGVDDMADAIGPDGTGIVAWTEFEPGVVKVATLRPSAAAQVVTLAGPPAGTVIGNLGVGLDGGARPVVSWTTTPSVQGSPSQTTALNVARGAGDGTFGAAVAMPLTTSPVVRAQAVVQGSGALTMVWSEGIVPGALTVRTADLGAGATGLGAGRTLATLSSGALPSIAGALNGRVAVFYGLGTGGKSGVLPQITLRSTSGIWGSPHSVGPSGTRAVRSMSAGVDASGRTVILWDDGSAASSPNRILAARSSSSSDPPGTYHQLPQRSGDSRCAMPTLILSTSGDGLGAWQCNTSTKTGQPRLARLTKAS